MNKDKYNREKEKTNTSFSYNPDDPKTKDFLSNIGEIIVSLNCLENNIDFSIWELLNAEGTPNTKQVIGRLVTKRLDFKGKIDLLRDLVVHRLGEEKDKDFRTIYTLLQESSERRNDIAHSIWLIQYGSDLDDHFQTIKINENQAFKKGKNFNFTKAIKTIELSDFEKDLELINNAQRELLSFLFIEKE